MKYIVYFCFAIIGIACHRNTTSTSDAPVGISSIEELSSYLGCPIDSVPAFDQFTKQRAVVTSDEDETIRWLSLDYLKQDKVVFSLESDWVNPDKVARITVLDSCIRNGAIYVDQKLGMVRNFISPAIPSLPGGELFVNVKGKPFMYLQYDRIALEFRHFRVIANSVISIIERSLRLILQEKSRTNLFNFKSN